MGIHEVMPVTETIKAQIVDKVPSGEIKRVAVKEGGLRTLRMDGIQKALMGRTTLDEVGMLTQRDTF
jgi:type IV pilus assembly protein PilB